MHQMTTTPKNGLTLLAGQRTFFASPLFQKVTAATRATRREKLTAASALPRSTPT